MIDEIITLPMTERKNLFTKVAYDLGISEPLIIEKDFWVSWSLHKLFQRPADEPGIIFKGGTSLSKAYNLIDRFSEDIDATIIRKDLGFIVSDEEIKALGNKRRKRYFEELYKATINTIEKQILPRLREEASSTLYETWELTMDTENHERVIFKYPSCFLNTENQYLLPRIIFEFGSRGDTVPTENRVLSSYVEKALPHLGILSPTVTVLKPERTFWEKILILHKLAHQPKEKLIQGRLSRHYYDVMMLSQSNVIDKAMRNPQLLSDVALHNMAYFRSLQASYDTAKFGMLKLSPSEPQLKILAEDYRLMRSMFMNEPPNFDELIKEILKIEHKLNG